MAPVMYDQMNCNQLKSPVLFTWQEVTDLCFSVNTDVAMGVHHGLLHTTLMLNGSIIEAPTSAEKHDWQLFPLFASLAKRKQFVVIVTSPVHSSVPV